jgi:GTP-binding protein
MTITSAEFVKSVANIKDIPKHNLKEIAFSGRSNVGKSSLINCLLNRKKLARTSATPGKTRQLNYYRINGQFFFVDLPGYGFAKVSKAELAAWRQLIEEFITSSRNLKGVISIIDSRQGPTQLDMQLIEWLDSLHQPLLLVATKTDKLSRSQLLNQMMKFSKQVEPYYKKEIIPFSVINGTGKQAIWNEILTLLE